ncbi:DEAD-box ATP-dependent RNA helicase DeaD (= CshA) [hydrothermal vent metagenome]|uniref:RNA helicase n=1 Tax=hydrothermal vent metagenome TaxID=652676 RepID=A0A3B0ZMV3_9ZZZZ
MTTETVTAFNQLKLKDALLKILDEIGYEAPSPIQAATIPLLLDCKDIIGQAQTGTGKTAAFALPLLSNLDLKQKDPQVLVLAPTRELAIQVAEAFQKYASKMKGFHVLPVYGGADYSGQIRALKRGVHVVVGTPGRVMDHIRKGTLKLDTLKALVLDEADEMLRMGFIDDVEWVLEQTPDDRQIALFSATMPSQIRRIATKYLTNPEQVTIKVKTTTAETIRQRFWPVSGLHKLDALTRILEAEEFDAMIIFVRTKTATVELTEKLEARGYSTGAINGDIQQNQRERTIQNLKNGKIDILVATDVAARGLDVPRISHVVNYDIPYDTEAYVHRIGRTGRAGKKGDAILFVAPREKGMLKAIERATKQSIDIMELPSTELINDNRVARFKQRITDTLASEGLEFYSNLITQYEQEHNIPAEEIATALAKLVQGDTPFLLQNKPIKKSKERWDNNDRPQRGRDRDRGRRDSGKRNEHSYRDRDESSKPEDGMQRFRIEVGHEHQVKPGNIVGAIANEAGIDSKFIGRINISDNYSLVDLPNDIPPEIFNDLKKVRVAGQKLNISALASGGNSGNKRAPTIRTKDKKNKDKRPKSKDKNPKNRKHKDSDAQPKSKKRNKDGTKKKKFGDDKPRKKLTL